ncbi:MAG: phosphoglycerate dehydrogenase [Candidatus Omnitrophota bacterium]
MYKILVCDPLSDEGLKILKKQKNFKVDIMLKQSPEELKKIIGEYDALLVRSGTKVTEDIIKHAKNLKVIGRAGVGLDNVDAAAATKKGIIVMNTPGGNTISTAEHTMSLMLSLSRNIPQSDASMKSGAWDRKKFMGVELYGKVLGIIGLGRIGTEVSKRALSFGMRVIAFDPFFTANKAATSEIELVDLKKLFSLSDYITVHTPLNNETRHIISKKEISMMKKGVRIINCARGGIIDEKAVLEAIESGIVAGAAFDVYENEPPKDSLLVKSPKVVATPHLGASTEEAQLNVAVEIASQVSDALLGKGIRNAVNIPNLDASVWNVLKPYVILTEKMGSMQSQLVDEPIKEVSITYSGDIVKHDTVAITTAFVKGLLTPVVGEMVNNVNATILAEERGIKVIESKTSQVEEFAHLITAKVTTKSKTSTISGALFANNKPRIVKIDNYYVDVEPDGHMILISNKDLPGVVGQVGTLLAKSNINIAAMTFGREKPGGRAVSICNVDSQVPEKLLNAIKKLKNIYDARLIEL